MRSDAVPAPALRGGPGLAALAGAVYVGVAWVEQPLASALALPASPSETELARGAMQYFAAPAALRLPVLGAIVVLLASAAGAQLRVRLSNRTPLALATVALLTIAVSVALDALGIHRWAWRESFYALRQAEVLVESRQLTAIVFWTILFGGVYPFIEEVVFRFGMLELIRQRLGPSGAIAATAALFALAHPSAVVGSLHGDSHGLVFLFVFGGILGAMAARSNGSLAACCVMHIAWNVTEGGSAYALVAIGRA